jgi:hypothetical protein
VKTRLDAGLEVLEEELRTEDTAAADDARDDLDGV